MDADEFKIKNTRRLCFERVRRTRDRFMISMTIRTYARFLTFFL